MWISSSKNSTWLTFADSTFEQLNNPRIAYDRTEAHLGEPKSSGMPPSRVNVNGDKRITVNLQFVL